MLQKNATNEVSENYLPSIINLNNAELALMYTLEAQKNHIIAPDDETMRTLENNIKTHQETINEALAGFAKTLDVGEETEAFEKFSKVLDDFLRLNAQVILFSQTNDDDKAQALSVGEANDVFQEAFSLMKIMLQTNIVGSENAKNAADTAFQTGSVLILVMSMLSVMIVIIVAILIGNSIAKPILIITEAARSLATDDATLTGIDTTKLAKIIVRKDEIGDIGRAYDTLANYFKALSEDFVQVSQGLAAGNLNITPKAEYKGDFVKVKEALEASLANLKLVINDIVQVSQGLAVGDLQVMPKAKYNGDFAQIKDGLDTTLFYLGEVIRDIVQVSQGLAEGNVITTKTEYLGDFTKIQNALEVAVTKLADATNKNKVQDWLKSGQAKLNSQIAGEQEIFSMSKKTISFLTTYIEAEIGLFYILTEDQKYLQLIASYAYLQENKVTNKTKLTEGLAGQAALEQKIIRRTQTPEECPAIVSSGLARSLPQYVILLPFLYENEVKGVIEIGSTTAITDIQHSFLEQIMPNIGIAVNTANSRSKMQKLLEQSQQQSEELQSQQEELQQTNEELQNQSEELQTQQEELRQSNEILGERTKDLERQKIEAQDKNQALEVSKIEMEKAKEAIVLKAEELELASKYKSEFLANMSHELRTPLNSLLILSQLLTENTSGNLDDKQVEYAKTINSAGNDLLTLINDILDLSKVEAGKVEVQWENVSLSKLLTSIEQKFSPIANDKQVTFNLTIASDIPDNLVTDSQRIKQIINNLLSNALKFTGEGKVKLTVQYPTELPANVDKLELNKTIAISVTDTGIGIPKDKQQSIFEAFQQADGSTSRRYGGTGLGLSISRQLARLLGGELTLTSETDKGSTFTLYLPEISSSLSQPPSSVEQSLLTEEYELPKEVLLVDDRNNLSDTDITILVIEDDRKFSNIIIELAKEKGFKCLLAEDGLAGLNLAEEYKPDAIILDIGLPKLDGLTLMRKLKDNPSTRHIPVHFMSATDQTIDAKKMGAIGYLVKPVNMEKLKEAFKNIEIFLAKTVKKLLIIVDSEPNKQKIMDLVADEDLQIEVSVTSEEACNKLLATTYDCVILDMDLEQASGGKLLERMQQEKSQPCKIPIIVYANRNLTIEEEALLLRCSNEIPIKPVSSPERLVDEATLFLHQLETNLSGSKRKMLHMVHDKKAILKHKKVLIVDDDERNIFALATVLENYDSEVICGVNGKEGLELLEFNDDIAIVLMDIMMPEMDGYEAIRRIRKHKKYHDLPIIALTAKAMKDDKAKCIEAGANDYLAKPVETDKLLSLMRVWLYR